MTRGRQYEYSAALGVLSYHFHGLVLASLCAAQLPKRDVFQQQPVLRLCVECEPRTAPESLDQEKDGGGGGNLSIFDQKIIVVLVKTHYIRERAWLRLWPLINSSNKNLE
jgi:hypothetical protein